MKVSSMVLSMSQRDPGVKVRAAPRTPLSIKLIAPGCVISRLVKYTSNQVRYLKKKNIRFRNMFDKCIYNVYSVLLLGGLNLQLKKSTPTLQYPTPAWNWVPQPPPTSSECCRAEKWKCFVPSILFAKCFMPRCDNPGKCFAPRSRFTRPGLQYAVNEHASSLELDFNGEFG